MGRLTLQEKNGQRYKDERIAHLVRLCARGFNRSLQLRLADHDVTFGQWIFLRILWKEEGLTQRELSERAKLTEPTTHTALGRLERQGLIVRRSMSGNRRKLHVFLTKQGRALRNTLEPLAIEANERALKGIGSDERERLRDVLILILDNLAADEAEAEAQGRRVPATKSASEV